MERRSSWVWRYAFLGAGAEEGERNQSLDISGGSVLCSGACPRACPRRGVRVRGGIRVRPRLFRPAAEQGRHVVLPLLGDVEDLEVALHHRLNWIRLDVIGYDWIRFYVIRGARRNHGCAEHDTGPRILRWSQRN